MEDAPRLVSYIVPANATRARSMEGDVQMKTPEDANCQILLLQKMQSYGMLSHLLTKGRPNWRISKTNR